MKRIEMAVPSNTQMLANHRLRETIQRHQNEITAIKKANDELLLETKRLDRLLIERDRQYDNLDAAYHKLDSTLKLITELLDEQIKRRNYSHPERDGVCKSINYLIERRLENAKWIKCDEGIPF